MTRTQWNAIACAYRLPTTTLHRYIHTYIHACMHACVEMTTSSHPLNVLMNIFSGGGDIDRRVGTAASLMLRVDSWMTDLKAMMVMRICVMIGRRMTYFLSVYTQRQRTTGPTQKNKWDQDRSPITGNNHSRPIEMIVNIIAVFNLKERPQDLHLL